MKKVYWPETISGKENKVTPISITADNVSIRTSGKYFFLPATGNYRYYFSGEFTDAGAQSLYWSSTPINGGEAAYYLSFFFNKDNPVNTHVAVFPDYRSNGFLPMVAE